MEVVSRVWALPPWRSDSGMIRGLTTIEASTRNGLPGEDRKTGKGESANRMSIESCSETDHLRHLKRHFRTCFCNRTLPSQPDATWVAVARLKQQSWRTAPTSRPRCLAVRASAAFCRVASAMAAFGQSRESGRQTTVVSAMNETSRGKEGGLFLPGQESI